MLTELACIVYLIEKYHEEYDEFFKKYSIAITRADDGSAKYYQRKYIKTETKLNELVRQKEALENELFNKGV